MLRITYILSLVVSVLLFTSCEPDKVVPDQHKIYQCYTADYNASIDKTTCKADFYLNAPSSQTQQRIELTHPAQVEYGEKLLVFDAINRSYVKEFVGENQSEFIYTNYDGATFTNMVEFPEEIQLELSSDSTGQQFDYYLEVLGDPLQPNETIELRAVSLESDHELFASYTDLSALIIQISTTQLAALGAGEVVVTASRKALSTSLTNANPVGGEAHIMYSVQDTLTIY